MPVIVWLILEDQRQLAFFLFVLAGITDALDGYLAKQLDMRTELGAWLDPAADKALLMSIYVALGYIGLLPLWLVIAVLSRDILIVGAILLSWIMDHPVTMKPLYISKANTAAQIVLAALVLANSGFNLGMDYPAYILVWIVGGLIVLSTVSYLRIWIAHMAGFE